MSRQRKNLSSSRYRYIVVPRGLPFWGVYDRATEKLIRDDLTRREARELVRWHNSRSGEEQT